MKLLAPILAFCSCAQAFSPSRLPSTTPQRVVLSKGKFMADVASPEPEPPVLPTPAMMDEGIFKFNKILIDSVYNIICFFYPVTGGKRDFARFYVLETVARVPYFAYLSVMHLR